MDEPAYYKIWQVLYREPKQPKQLCMPTVLSVHAGASLGLWCWRHLWTITVWAWPSPPPFWGCGPVPRPQKKPWGIPRAASL